MTKINENTQYYHGYKFRIYPTKEQAEFIDQCIDIARYVYNWTIERQEKQYQLYLDGNIDIKDSFLSVYDLMHEFSIYRKSDSTLQKCPLGMCRESIMNAHNAYKMYFTKKANHPRFKSRYFSKPTYHTRSDRMWIAENKLRIEGLPHYSNYNSDTIKIDRIVKEYDFSKEKFVDPTISRDNLGRYFVSFCIVKDKPLLYFEDNILKMDRAIGIDLNLRRDARIVCSDGTRFIAPDISRKEEKIKILQRIVQKDIDRRKELERTNSNGNIEPSKRSEKRKIKLNKAYNKIRNINNTFYDMSIKKIIDKHPKAIVMEDLDITSQIKAVPWFADKITFNPLYIIREKIQKKCNMYNIPFILAPREYPSTTTCSNCGHIKKMYSSKTYICPNCGMRMDRDDNAALNLERLAYTVDFTNISNINLATI